MATRGAIGACMAALGLVGAADAAVMRISPDSVPSLVESGEFDIIVDVRGHSEYERGHLPGAVRGISELPQECRTSTIKIGVYCWTGWDRSTPAAYYLESQITEEGAKVYDLGGFQYYESPPIEEGPPQYTHEELVNICVPSATAEDAQEEGGDPEENSDNPAEASQDEDAPQVTSEEQTTAGDQTESDDIQGAELLPPLFDGDDSQPESEPEPESSNQLSSEASDSDGSNDASSVDTEEHEYAVVYRIRAEKAFDLAPSFDYVVDTRSRREYDRGHIPGAVWGVEALPTDCKDAYIAVYCWHGWDRSSPAAMYLASQGFKHVYDIGGLQYMDVEASDLSTVGSAAKPCPPGGSSANVAAILAAEPSEMPDSIVDGRKGCDGMINSGKMYDVCGICEGGGSPCGDASSISSAHKTPEERAHSTGIFYGIGIISTLCLGMMAYSVCMKKSSQSNTSAQSKTDIEKVNEKSKTAKLHSVVMPNKGTSEGVFMVQAHSEFQTNKHIPSSLTAPRVNELYIKFQHKQQLKDNRTANGGTRPFAPPPPPPLTSTHQVKD